jgi:hypothetical protein
MRLLIGSARRYALGAGELLALMSRPGPPDLIELSAGYNTVLRAVSDLRSAIDQTWEGGKPSIEGWPDPIYKALFVIYHQFTVMMEEIEGSLYTEGWRPGEKQKVSWDAVGLTRDVGTECIFPCLGGAGPWIEVLLRPENPLRPLFDCEAIDAIDRASVALEQACQGILPEGDDETEKPTGPLAETLALIPHSPLALNLIPYLHGKPDRTATLKQLCRYIYKAVNKRSLANCRLLIKRTDPVLDNRGAPLRIVAPRRILPASDISLIDC